jgi:general stress protein YciG
MDLKALQRKAKQMIDKRGGADSLKEDAEELRDIAKGPGGAADKAKRAAEALKDPGAAGPDAPPPSAPAPPGRSPEP